MSSNSADRTLPRNTIESVTRFVKFGLVGVTGLVVNTLALALATGVLGIHYLVGAALATQASTIWNYVFTDRWVFATRQTGKGQTHRFAIFWTINNLGLLARGPMIFALTEWLHVHYLVSNLISLVAIMLVRYAASDLWIWRHTTPDAPPAVQ